MTNPILQALNAASPAARNSNNMIARLAEIKKALGGQTPEVLYNRMLQTNPAFAQFVQQNAGKSAEQIAQEYGVDMNALRSLLK